METSHVAQRLSRRFVAGETLADALNVGRRINSEGISLTLDHLGENVTSLAEAERSRDAYLRALTELHAAGIEGNVSLKLTQFGMDISEPACRANVAQVVRTAAALGSFVRVDMESSAYTERTLRMVCDLHTESGAVGAVIQAYLFRSEGDTKMLSARRVRVRLCKGAYLEPHSVAFAQKADVDRNYVHLMQMLLGEGVYPAIATHDVKMIDATRQYAAAHGIGQDRFEFQMLYGIRRDLQRQLVTQGYRLRLYVPFGKAWYPYFMRRLAERPANLFFLLRNLLRK
jgi:proline dehydrogenase